MPNRKTDAASQGKLLPTVIEELAVDEPDGLWAEYSRSLTYDAGFSGITYAQFANAVNGIAHFLESVLGRKDTGETLGWLAPNDPRCIITIVAAMKAGFKLFLVSERNNVAANYKLFDDTGCSVLVTTNLSFRPVRDTLSGRSMASIELPSIDDLLHGTYPAYPYSKLLNCLHKDTALIVHTSGSTGFPKPMWLSHGFVMKVGRNLGLTAPEGFDMQNTMIADNRGIFFLPLSHPAGISLGLINAIFNNSTIILQRRRSMGQ